MEACTIPTSEQLHACVINPAAITSPPGLVSSCCCFLYSYACGTVSLSVLSLWCITFLPKCCIPTGVITGISCLHPHALLLLYRVVIACNCIVAAIATCVTPSNSRRGSGIYAALQLTPHLHRTLSSRSPPPSSQHLVCERHLNTSFQLIKSLLHRSHSSSFAPRLSPYPL